jgi:hypothetical protein
MKPRLFALIVLLFVGLFCSGQYDDAFKIPYPERFCMLRDTLSKLMDRQPLEKRDPILNVFKKAAVANKDERALLMETFFRFSFKMDHQDFSEKEMLAIANSVLQQCEELDFENFKGFVLMTMGYYYKLKNNPALSLYYLLKAHDVYAPLPVNAYNFKGVALINLAMIFYRFDDFARAIHYGKEGDSYPLKTRNKMYNYNVVGMSYLKSGQYDSALLYFDKTKLMADELEARNWLGIVNGNKAHVFTKMNQVDSAMHYYKLGIDTTYHYNLLDNACGFAIGLARIYYNQNRQEEVAALLPMAKIATWQGGAEKDRLALYGLLKDYYNKAGYAAQALTYSDSAAMWKDSVNARLGKNLQVQAELAHETEKRQSGEQLLNKEISSQRIFRMVAIVMILLVLFIGVLMYNRQRLKHKMHQQQFKAKEQEAAQELALATQQLHEFTQIITEKNKLIELMESQTVETINTEQIRQLQNNILLTDEQWNKFKELFEKVHLGFFNRLREKFPGLTPAETRFFALAKLRLTTKEMAASQGITPHAVRTIWYRLRKKMNLPEEESWEGLVEEI